MEKETLCPLIVQDDSQELNTVLRNNTFFGRNDVLNSVAYCLVGMGLEQYISLFQSESINFEEMMSLTEDDLKVIGINDPNHRQIFMTRIKKRSVDHASNEKLLPREELLIATYLFQKTNSLNCDLLKLSGQLRSTQFLDYYVSRDYSAVKLIRTVAEKALQQCDLITKRLNSDDCGLLADFVKMENLTLSPAQKKNLAGKGNRRIRKKLLYFLTAVGTASMSILLYNNYFV